ncbi:protein FAM50A isoform X1 [Anser cygnoides]|uniref:protein FAM50A isoform X1 n=1 Tax=Anser cygnoides TaxID=8845 RepID=UPI0034D2840C
MTFPSPGGGGELVGGAKGVVGGASGSGAGPAQRDWEGRGLRGVGGVTATHRRRGGALTHFRRALTSASARLGGGRAPPALPVAAPVLASSAASPLASLRGCRRRGRSRRGHGAVQGRRQRGGPGPAADEEARAAAGAHGAAAAAHRRGEHAEGQHRQEVLGALRRRGGRAEIQHRRAGDAERHEGQAGGAGEGARAAAGQEGAEPRAAAQTGAAAGAGAEAAAAAADPQPLLLPGRGRRRGGGRGRDPPPAARWVGRKGAGPEWAGRKGAGPRLSPASPSPPPRGAPRKRKLGKNPDVDTSFLPDREREEEENRLREELRQEWEAKQEKIKNEEIEITFSYWDGSGHRRTVKMKKGNTMQQFLQKALEILRKDFSELRSAGVEQLMYIKEDLIIPHHHSFYDFIVTKARGKSGPLFNFDVHDDVRLLSDATVEKDESHAGKVVLRSWYEKNKHIFPASRWEPYDPEKKWDKYTIR